MAYKRNVGDTRESPALEIIQSLEQLGASVDYSDPHVPHLQGTRRHPLKRLATNLNDRVLQNYDGVVLITDHDVFDYDNIIKHAKLIVDTRGRFDGANKKVWLA